MRELFLAMIAGLGLASGAAAQNETQNDPVVVELYTSQGCSSCPPADALLSELAGRDDVIPLALHVDYWDYIGWADSFADSDHTRRQKAYARAAGERTIYTPQMIVGGKDHVVGARPMHLADLIQSHAAQQDEVDLTLAREGDRLRIAARAERPVDGPLTVQVVRYDPEETVEIGRGENAGHTFTYSNVVTSWQVIGAWDGTGRFEVEMPVTGDEPVVVIVQERGPGRVLAAARLD